MRRETNEQVQEEVDKVFAIFKQRAMQEGVHSEAEVTNAFEKAVQDWARIFRVRGQPAGAEREAFLQRRADEELTKIAAKKVPDSKETAEAVEALLEKAQKDAATGVGIGLEEKKAEGEPKPMGYHKLAKDIVSQVQSVARQAFSEGAVDAKETTKRQRRAIQMLLTERLGEEETVKPDAKVGEGGCGDGRERCRGGRRGLRGRRRD